MNLLRLLPLLAAASLSAASVSTFAGTGEKGYSGDGGPATAAKMDNPFGVVRGPDGAIWYCEYTGQRIRRVGQDGKITLIAGTGKVGYSGDGGPATAATFRLRRIAVSSSALNASNTGCQSFTAKPRLVKRASAGGDASHCTNRAACAARAPRSAATG